MQLEISAPMQIQIADILSPAECSAIRDAVNDEALWRDGKATAGGAAKQAKHNLQADASAPPIKGVLRKIESALRAHPVFAAAALPDEFARLIVSKYGAGMEYGEHVDAAYIEGVRADLSFTLFLSAPDEYSGGELIVAAAGHDDEIKLPAGALVLYPSTSIHRVAPVKDGERIAVVGWIKSRVRSGDARQILYDLACAIEDTRDAAHRLRLANIRNNLLRFFGE